MQGEAARVLVRVARRQAVMVDLLGRAMQKARDMRLERESLLPLSKSLTHGPGCQCQST